MTKVQTNKVQTNIVAHATAQLKAALLSLEEVRKEGELSQVEFPSDEDEVSPEIIGQLLMCYFGCEGFRPTLKQSLCLMAEHMGPDYIAQLRAAAAFMDKVESFH